jgi:nitrogen fixation/metabolism regulation signal transduction histidine kinase
MKRSSRLRTKLIVVFLAATLAPIVLTLWTSIFLLERSLDLAPIRELDQLSKSLERVGQKLYQRACESLKSDVALGRIKPVLYASQARTGWPAEVTEFWESEQPERFSLSGANGDTLTYLVRNAGGVTEYSAPMGGAGLDRIREQYAGARTVVENARTRNWKRGFIFTVVSVSGAVWLASMAALLYWAHRISRPVQQLTDGLTAVGAGDLEARVPVQGDDEIAGAIAAFNHMADQIEKSRERLVHVTRLASWQAVARKMAHEVKNSLTPIRLTMEEIIARYGGSDTGFLEQAAQIVVDEVNSLERRVRAFSEFAAEPPVSPCEFDMNAMIEERLALLKSAHPEVLYRTRLASGDPRVSADPDLIKGVLTNLLENAADAVQPGGVVLASSAVGEDGIHVEVHDSGPGLSAHARASLFEPTISFKRGGMGLGLSIARKSALLCGGDLSAIEGELGGAAFRLTLPIAEERRTEERQEPVGAANEHV